MLQVLDAAALRQWCTAGLEALTAARQEIDDLNVYPVPDGDTGTNLQLTMAATAEAVHAAPTDLPSTVAALVHGSLLGARGNSGVILSQLLRGLGESLTRPAGPEELRAALVRSAESAYTAVAAPELSMAAGSSVSAPSRIIPSVNASSSTNSVTRERAMATSGSKIERSPPSISGSGTSPRGR